MQLSTDLKFGQLQWDRYQAFHRHDNRNIVIRFETGEVCVTPDGYRYKFGADDYRRYPDHGFALCLTSDLSWTRDLFTFLHPETREPLTGAALSKLTRDATSSQLLLIDFRHEVAVKMAKGMHRVSQSKMTTPVPKYASRIGGVYYAHEDAFPVGASVSVSEPRRYSAEEKKHIDNMVAACKAWWQMSVANSNHDAGRSYTKYQQWQIFHELHPEYKNKGNAYYNVMSEKIDVDRLEGSDFAGLCPTVKFRAAAIGIVHGRDVEKFDYIPVKINA